MAELKQVTGTAFIVAAFRADESKEAEPLYRDAIAPLFLDAATWKAAEDFSASFPPLKELVKIRTRYLDDRLDAQLRQGFSQVVILGAGFDTRAVRKQTPGVTFFEIDDPALLTLKKERLEANHIDAAAKLIPGNYLTDDLPGMLESSGFDAALPTHFIWEGNTMYLSAEAVHHVMQTIVKHVKQFTLAFDYMAPEAIAKTTGDPAITRVVERFAAMGAPWIFGIGNLAELAAREGMAVVEDHNTASLYRAYRPGGTLDSPLFCCYSLCTLAPARRLTR